MKTKLKNLFSILLLCLCIWPYNVAAQTSNCTPEQIDGARKAAQESAKGTCDAVKTTANSFNTAAADFISTCATNLAPVPILPSEETLSLAAQAGTEINDPELYKYRGVQWNKGDFSLLKDTCVPKLDALMKSRELYESTLRNCTSQLNATSDNALSQCSCDNANHEPECHSIDETGEEESQEGYCYPFTTYLGWLNKCPLCPVFEVILNTNADVAHIAWEATAEPLSKIVALFFLVMLAFEVLKAVAAVGGVKPSALIKGVLILCLKFGITIALLSKSTYIYHMFISPVIQGGLDMGLALAQSGGGTGVTCGSSIGSIASQEFDPELFNNIMCTIKAFTETASTMPAVGMGMVCHSFHPLSMKLFLCGLIMLLFGVLIWLAFSFYLIDATVQLGMLGAMVPLLIACWPLKMTQQYTTKGVRMLMNSFFTYTLAGVLMLLGSKVMLAAVEPPGGVTVNELITAINSSNGEALQRITSLDGLNLLMLVACGIFAMKLIANLSGLSNQFASGSGMNAGAKMGTMAASAATSGAKAVAHYGGVAGGHIAGAVGDKLAQTETGAAVIAGAKAVKSGAQKAWAGGWSKAGQKVGLGRFQNKNAGSGATGQGTSQEQGRTALPDQQQTPPNQPPPDQPPPNQPPDPDA